MERIENEKIAFQLVAKQATVYTVLVMNDTSIALLTSEALVHYNPFSYKVLN